MTYLLRLVLPDRPGALGAVATALGQAEADILSVDVVERAAGHATDDIVIEIPTDRLADSLVSAAATVPGVRVESIQPYAGQLDAHRELALLDAIGTHPENAWPLLADGATKIFRAGWSLVLGPPVRGQAAVRAAGGAAPEITALFVPWWPPRPARSLEPEERWAPPSWARIGTELAVAPLRDDALLVGRPALRWRPAELVRLNHLASIAAGVTGSVQVRI